MNTIFFKSFRMTRFWGSTPGLPTAKRTLKPLHYRADGLAWNFLNMLLVVMPPVPLSHPKAVINLAKFFFVHRVILELLKLTNPIKTMVQILCLIMAS